MENTMMSSAGQCMDLEIVILRKEDRLRKTNIHAVHHMQNLDFFLRHKHQRGQFSRARDPSGRTEEQHGMMKGLIRSKYIRCICENITVQPVI